MTAERETALIAAQKSGCTDPEILRRADLFYRFIMATPACEMSLIFSNIYDPITGLPVAGVVPFVNGHAQVPLNRAFTVSAAVTGLEGEMISAFTTAIDDPDIANVQMPYSDYKTVQVVPTSLGTATITVADDNFSFSFKFDVIAAV